MNEFDTRVLEYVRNTNGGATKGNFIEDWEPIGDRLFAEYWQNGWITLNEDKRVVLTDIGRSLIT